MEERKVKIEKDVKKGGMKVRRNKYVWMYPTLTLRRKRKKRMEKRREVRE